MDVVPSGSGTMPDFGFAMETPHFKDRTLRIEIFADDAGLILQPPLLTNVASTGSMTGDVALQQSPHLVDDDSSRPHKRRRETGNSEVKISEEMKNDKETGNSEVKISEEMKNDKETETSKVKGAKDNEGNSLCSFAPLKQVKTIAVASVLLAEKSDYFRVMFTRNMKESLQNDFTLKITESEEEPLDLLLEFIYKNKVSIADPVLLIKIMMAADKFSVPNAMVFCCSVLRSLPMTTELALFFLENPSASIVVDNVLKGLRATSGQFLVNAFRHVTKSEQTLFTMPLSAIMAIFASSEIVVPSEGYVFSFLARWCWKQFENHQKKLEVFDKHLVPLVRFIHVSPADLHTFLSLNIIEPKKFAMLTINSIMYRSDASNRHFHLELENSMIEQRVYYKAKPIRSVNLAMPFHECQVFVDFSKADLENLASAGEIVTQQFSIGTHQLHLRARLKEEPAGSGLQRFGFFLGVENLEGPVNFTARFSVRRADGVFVVFNGFTHAFTGTMSMGVRDVFRVPWNQFLIDRNFLLDDFLYMKAEIKLLP